jgi:Phage integrase family
VRAGLERASEVRLYTLRHMALSRMIAAGFDDYTVMAISGHSSTRMLARYTHPDRGAEARSAGVVQCGQNLGRTAQYARRALRREPVATESIGGRHEARTRDLSVANAALSQLS